MSDLQESGTGGSGPLQEKLNRRLEELEGLLEASAGLIFRVRTSDLALVYAAPNTGDVTGIPVEAWTNDPQFWTERVPDEDVERIVEHVWEARDSGRDRFEFDFRLRHANDELHRYHGVFQFERDEAGDPASFVGTAVDVTTEHRRERTLRQQEERYRALFEDSAEAVIVSDRTGTIHQVNEAFVELSGYSRDELKDAHTFDFYAAPERRRELFDQLESEGRVEDFAVRLRRADGAIRSCMVTASWIEVDDEALIQVVLRDVTEREKQREALRHQALHDPLTGLPNRALFWDRLQQALARLDRQGGLGALLYLDLNGFKQVNDSHGHQAGDEVLIEVGRRLEAAIRESDTVARIGGDEFVMVLPELEDSDGAREVARRALESLTDPIQLDSADVRLTAAVGIALVADEDRPDLVQISAVCETPDEVLQAADAAMYRAKEEEGSAVALYSSRVDAGTTSS